MRFAQWNIGKWTMVLYRTRCGFALYRGYGGQFDLHLGFVSVYKWGRY